jgi:hypothetical protein
MAGRLDLKSPHGWNASVTQDHGIGSARMTLEVLMAAVDAPSEWDARVECLLPGARREPCPKATTSSGHIRDTVV